MKTSKIVSSFSYLFLAFSLFGLAIAGWLMLDYGLRLQLPLHALWFGVKALCFAGIVLIGLSLHRLLRQYTQLGFFNETSTSAVRLIGLLTIGVALANSLFHVLTEQVISVHATALPSFQQLAGSWLTDLLFESPILIFFSLLVFVFASFMAKAIQVKHEAESFI